MSRSRKALWLLAIALMLVAADAPRSQQPGFHLEEATIDDMHRSIRTGQITCRGLIQLYIERAKAYNGVSNMLVTADGEPIPPAPGVVRAGAPLRFPTQTVAISSLLPNFDQYAGPPIEFGRMESTASDPTVQQQFGMTVGIPNAGQLIAIGVCPNRCHPARQRSAKNSENNQMLSNALPNLMRNTVQILT